MKSLFATVVASYLLVAASAAGGLGYSYEPRPNWGGTCNNGLMQSPINLVATSTAASPNVKIQTFGTVDEATYLFTGDSVKVEFSSFSVPPAVAIPVNGYHGDTNKEYVKVEPLQMHIHTVSEHTIEGVYSPAELHIVCKVIEGETDDCDEDPGCLAVFGIMMKHTEKDATSTNAVVEDIFSTVKSSSAGTPIATTINLDDLIPANTEYFTYLGSLTTPPCSEIVTWHVFKNPIAISKSRVVDHQELVADCASGTCKEKTNHRELQDCNDRPVTRIDECEFVSDLADFLLGLLGGLLG